MFVNPNSRIPFGKWILRRTGWVGFPASCNSNLASRILKRQEEATKVSFRCLSGTLSTGTQSEDLRFMDGGVKPNEVSDTANLILTQTERRNFHADCRMNKTSNYDSSIAIIDNETGISHNNIKLHCGPEGMNQESTRKGLDKNERAAKDTSKKPDFVENTEKTTVQNSQFSNSRREPRKGEWKSNDLVATLISSQETVSKALKPLRKSLQIDLLDPSRKRHWTLSYDHTIGELCTGIGDNKRRSVAKNLNPNQAAVTIAQKVQKKIESGYKKAPNSARIPKFISEYKAKTNHFLDWVESHPEDQNLHVLLEKERNGNAMFWYVSVVKQKLNCRWGLASGKLQKHQKNFADSGKGGRSANQQARFHALRLIMRKIELSGYSIYTKRSTEKKSQKMSSAVIDGSRATDEDSLFSPPPPMLASICDLNRIGDYPEKVFVQPKLDGLRCVADLTNGNLFSRSRQPIGTLEHISDFLLKHKDLRSKKFRWLDGELYIHGKNIQWISSVVRSSTGSPEARKQVRFFAFDAYMDGDFQVRWDTVSDWYSSLPNGKKKAVELTKTNFQLSKSLPTVHQDFTRKGYEGVMVRLPNSGKYASGKRSRDLQKIKSFQREEYVCTAILPQKLRGKDSVAVAGACQLRTEDGKVFKATPKCTVEEKIEMWKNRRKYEGSNYLAMVQYFELSDDKVPRFPVVVGFRHKDDT